jgi:hypothetical protein
VAYALSALLYPLHLIIVVDKEVHGVAAMVARRKDSGLDRYWTVLTTACPLLIYAQHKKGSSAFGLFGFKDS